MEYKELKERIKEHEGYRNTIYKDSLGFATIGYGHLVTPEDPYKEDIEYPKSELDAQFEADFQTAKAHTEKLINDNNVAELLFNAKCVLIEMVFQLGVGGVLNLKRCGLHYKNKITMKHQYKCLIVVGQNKLFHVLTHLHR
jgi:GH24 family phage-related lysozyme (muramidase)